MASGSVIWFSPKRIPSLNRGQGSVETPGSFQLLWPKCQGLEHPHACSYLQRRHSPDGKPTLSSQSHSNPGQLAEISGNKIPVELGSLSGELLTGEPARCWQGHRLVCEQIWGIQQRPFPASAQTLGPQFIREDQPTPLGNYHHRASFALRLRRPRGNSVTRLKILDISYAVPMFRERC